MTPDQVIALLVLIADQALAIKQLEVERTQLAARLAELEAAAAE